MEKVSDHSYIFSWSPVLQQDSILHFPENKDAHPLTIKGYMRKIIAITAILLCSLAHANAQTFLEHLQDKQAKGAVTVKQSKAIDDLVNANSTQQVKNTPAPNNEKKTESAHSQTNPNTHHQEKPQDNKAKADSARLAQQQKEREESRRQEAQHHSVTQDNTDNVDLPPVDTRKKVMRNSRKVNGYRVQAFAGGNSRQDRNKAQSIGNNIKQHFPSEPVYVHFYSPRWICRVGNYRSFAEAEAMLKQLKKLGYQSACIVKGKITVQY